MQGSEYFEIHLQYDYNFSHETAMTKNIDESNEKN